MNINNSTNPNLNQANIKRNITIIDTTWDLCVRDPYGEESYSIDDQIDFHVSQKWRETVRSVLVIPFRVYTFPIYLINGLIAKTFGDDAFPAPSVRTPNTITQIPISSKLLSMVQKCENKFDEVVLHNSSIRAIIHYKDVPTPRELGVMSNSVYAEGNIIDSTDYINLKSVGWELFGNHHTINDHAYKGVAYYHEIRKQLVIAHRGTVDSKIKNIISDLYVMIGKEFEANNLAYDYSKTIRENFPEEEYQITETGHSLGAIHAESNCYKFGNCKAITFDSPGSKELIESIKDIWKREIVKNNFTVYLSNPNFINTSNSHIGNKIRIYTPYVKDGDLSLFKAVGESLFSFVSSIITSNEVKLVEVTAKFIWERFTALPQAVLDFEFNKHGLINILKNFDSYTGQPFLVLVKNWGRRVVISKS